jgi:hypothetical protein
MARGKRIEGKTLTVYSTKVTTDFRVLLDALAKANGPEFGQRELLEDMAKYYLAANPEKAEKARTYLQVLGFSEDKINESLAVKAETPEPQADEKQKAASRTVLTVRYKDSPKVHLYEPHSKNSTGCGLAGTIDPDTIMEQSPDAVTCGKCRYCRKAVFA